MNMMILYIFILFMYFLNPDKELTGYNNKAHTGLSYNYMHYHISIDPLWLCIAVCSSK